MRILPFFLEDEGLKCSRSISLAQNMKVLGKEEARIISGYMESCVVIQATLSNIVDPITGRASIPSQTWSDGVYVWAASHSHYVKHYRVRLPDEFVGHVMRQLTRRFDAGTLDAEALRARFEPVLRKVVKGDESYYAY